MPAKPSLVANSSPLIALVAALPDFDVLSHLVNRFVIPAEVMTEVEAGGLKDCTAERVRSASWCEIRDTPAQIAPHLVSRLGSGEAAVIQIASDEGLLAVIDEVSGRRAARIEGLHVIGSLGILVELHHAGLLPDLTDSISAMQAKGIHLAPHLISMTLEAAKARHK